MAHTLTTIIPKLLARGLVALRQNTIMPMLVNRGYEPAPGEKGSTVTIPVPTAITAAAVTPAITYPANTDITPTAISLTMDQWYSANFYLADKDIEEIEANNTFLPMQASEAIKALANAVDADILSKYTGIYGWGGTPGTTPFSADLTEYLAARKACKNQLAPFGNGEPWNCVINADAEANALGLRAFQDASFRGDTGGIVSGEIGRKLGALWVVDQNIPTHTTGANTGSDVNGAFAIGIKSVDVHGGALGDFHVGDIITFAGQTQEYVVVTATGGATPSNITIEPGLKVALAGTEVITTKASHVVNLLFHRDAFAFASRPLAASSLGLGSIESIVDPVSGLTLRLELIRTWKQTIFSYDILWGSALVRRELAARIAG